MCCRWTFPASKIDGAAYGGKTTKWSAIRITLQCLVRVKRDQTNQQPVRRCPLRGIRGTPSNSGEAARSALSDITSDVIEIIPRKVHFLIHQERTTPSMRELVQSLMQ